MSLARLHLSAWIVAAAFVCVNACSSSNKLQCGAGSSTTCDGNTRVICDYYRGGTPDQDTSTVTRTPCGPGLVCVRTAPADDGSPQAECAPPCPPSVDCRPHLSEGAICNADPENCAPGLICADAQPPDDGGDASGWSTPLTCIKR